MHHWHNNTVHDTNSNQTITGKLADGHLGGVVVSVLATGPKGCGFDPGQDDGFLRTIQIHSTPSFHMESKVGGPMS
jgi:hypothetical protein